MKNKMTTYATIIMTLALTANAVLAQEETVEAAESSGSIGLMIAILGIGALVILGLGMAMNAQANSEQN